MLFFRDFDRLSSEVQWGGIPRPVVRGLIGDCAPGHAPLLNNQDALQVAINDDRFVQEIGDIDIRLFWYSRNGDDAVSNVTNAVYVIVPPGPNFIDT